MANVRSSYRWACRVISRITNSVKVSAFRLVRGFISRSLYLQATTEAKDIRPIHGETSGGFAARQLLGL